MLNSYSQAKVNIKTVSGTMVKNYKDSFFLMYKLHSNLANALYEENPHYYRRGCGKYCYTLEDERYTEPVVILQTMLISESEAMSEVMYKSDFDKLFISDYDRMFHSEDQGK